MQEIRSRDITGTPGLLQCRVHGERGLERGQATGGPTQGKDLQVKPQGCLAPRTLRPQQDISAPVLALNLRPLQTPSSRGSGFAARGAARAARRAARRGPPCRLRSAAIPGCCSPSPSPRLSAQQRQPGQPRSPAASCAEHKRHPSGQPSPQPRPPPQKAISQTTKPKPASRRGEGTSASINYREALGHRGEEAHRALQLLARSHRPHRKGVYSVGSPLGQDRSAAPQRR